MPAIVRIPIRQRQRAAAGSKPRDPFLNHMTQGVMVICLGFFLLIAGTLTTFLGLRKSSSSSTNALIIIGPVFLVSGLLCIIGGFIRYCVAYTRKKKRDNGHLTLNGSQISIKMAARSSTEGITEPGPIAQV
ncbi:unnamed protein product [Dimorphilus gyrociliatus]|uniref:Uncharacterized protein n=1 Tax=Dimorphilus gyrociliatus TaxID=2664684 RepID=A0A7I8VJR7_9ANNE|nr:unnamed protein product [Dimorphilus gyrociliatus]